ncbi:cell division protein FtsQ [Limimonas halophila]|uniref:Cell division protein FtsQ n=1 Tax=Limimonas halophila TaxID=1082479 RepID=A0A1G7U5D2_9PROT|nr:FtsQ-type POTRA domain-containing protein [Limimonas halophila]SDG42624.1 cell division protein FtsQ [Limimonas halophila]
MRRLIRPASSRRPAERAARRRTVLRGVIAVAALAVLAAGTWAVRAGLPGMVLERARAGVLAATADAGLAVASVTVTGRQRTEDPAILDALGVDQGTPMLAIDPATARTRLRNLPWVARARVERRFPGKLLVRLHEREPMAVHTRGEAARLIDWRGKPIRGVDPAGFPELLRVTGAGAPAHARDLLRALQAQPVLAERVARARWVAGRRWEVRLHNGVRVALPADGAADAWTRLARLEREKRVLQRDIKRIDLRPAQRIVLERGTPGDASGERRRNG